MRLLLICALGLACAYSLANTAHAGSAFQPNKDWKQSWQGQQQKWSDWLDEKNWDQGRDHHGWDGGQLGDWLNGLFGDHDGNKSNGSKGKGSKKGWGSFSDSWDHWKGWGKWKGDKKYDDSHSSIPTPSAAAAGLFGLAALAARRRKG